MERTLIKNADWIITMDPQRRKLEHCDILVEGNKILKIDKEIPEDEFVNGVIDAAGHIIIPGMVNTHHHFFQSLTRNIELPNVNSLED